MTIFIMMWDFDDSGGNGNGVKPPSGSSGIHHLNIKNKKKVRGRIKSSMRKISINLLKEKFSQHPEEAFIFLGDIKEERCWQIGFSIKQANC